MQTTRTSVHPWVAEGTRRARFGIDVNVLPDWPAIRDFAQTIEGLGFDSVWLPDHPMVTNNATWTSLAAMAAATEHIRLGTLVACASYWNPVVLARAAADIDRLSGGRFVLGLGSGDMPHEFRQMGLDWQPAPQRQATLDEALHIIPPLLRGETVDYDGERLHANGAALNPPPVQQPHVPILVAGGGEQTTLRYVAEHADACNLGAVSWAGGAFAADDIQHKFDVLRGHMEEVERPYDSVLRTGLLTLFLSDSASGVEAKLSQAPPEIVAFFDRMTIAGTPEEAVPRVQELLEAGFQYIIFITALPFDFESVQLLAERVLPAVA